jgi:hypothetical protein
MIMAQATLSSHIGGADAGVAVWDVTGNLSQALKLLPRKKYSSQIGKFRFHLMVSGEITNFKEPSGCVGVRLMKKDRYVKMEIVLGKEIWRGADQKAIKKHLADFVLQAFEMAIDKLKKQKIDVKETELINDVNNVVLKKFLN